jgi:oligopeptide/dipeptide ABC transporter ATP-binding protein
MSLLLDVKGLKKYYPISNGILKKSYTYVKAVDDVSFSLYEGETLGIVGESGCGKSTTGRTILRLTEPTAGDVIFQGKNLSLLKGDALRKIRRDMQIVFQDPYASLNPRMTVGRILEEPLKIHGLAAGTERKQLVKELLDIVGLNEHHYNRYPHEFSGGQRQRICIARALATSPEFIICDESVSSLDVSVQAQVLNLFMDIQEEMGLAYLFISHDLAVVRHVAHDVLVMYLGLAMEQGPKPLVFARPLHPYTQALLASTPGLSDRRHAQSLPKGELPSPLDPPQGCVFSTRCPHAAERCRAERPAARSIDGRQVACHFAERFLEQASGE